MAMSKYKIRFEIAEVIDVSVLQEGSDPENLYSVSVELFDTNTTQFDIQVRPSSFNLQTPPLVGELILVFNGPNQYSFNDKVETQWYYLCTLPIQSSVNQNTLLGAAGDRRKIATAELLGMSESELEDATGYMAPKKVNPLQPFSGDTILQGRFGNTIRLGSSKINTDVKTAVSPNWIGDSTSTITQTDPIIILSNTTLADENNNDAFARNYSIENMQKDASSLYLTSTQQLSTLKLNRNTDKSGGFSKFNQSQLIGVADRIILQSKTNSIILDSKTRITLNANETLLGSENATEPMVHGKELVLLLMDIINAIQEGTFGSGAVFSLPNAPGNRKLRSAMNRLKKITSSKHFMTK